MRLFNFLLAAITLTLSTGNVLAGSYCESIPEMCPGPMCQATQMICQEEMEAEANLRRYQNDKQVRMQRQNQEKRQQEEQDDSNYVNQNSPQVLERKRALEAYNDMPSCFHSKEERKLGEQGWKVIVDNERAMQVSKSLNRPDRLDTKAKNPRFIADCRKETAIKQ